MTIEELRKKYGAGADAKKDGNGTQASAGVAALRAKYGAGTDGGGVSAPAGRVESSGTAVRRDTLKAPLRKGGIQAVTADTGGAFSGGLGTAGGGRYSNEEQLQTATQSYEQRLKELDEIEADLKAFEMATQYAPANQRPVKDIGGFTSSQAAREEYDRVMAKYAALLKENGRTDSNFGRNVRYALEKGGAGLGAALEGLGDAAAAVLLDRRVGKALNGISPAVNIIQQVDGLTGNKVGGAAERMLKSNPSAQRMRDIENRYAPSKAGQVAGEVAQGVGGMLPSIAANIALPGSGMAVLGVQAGGQSAQQALNEGATLEQAVNYGVLSGALEAATEMLSGGLGGLGEGVIDASIGKLIAKNGTAKVGKVLAKVMSNSLVNAVGGSLGEGVEEGITAWLNPYLQRLTYNKDAEKATLGEVLHDAFIGVLTGSVFQGVGMAANLAAGQKNTVSGETGSAAVGTAPAEHTAQERTDVPQGESPVQQTPANAQKPTQEIVSSQPGVVLPITQESAQSATEMPQNRTEAPQSEGGQANLKSVWPAEESSVKKEKMKMEDFVNVNSPVWTNVPYEDVDTQRNIMQTTHRDMVDAGEVVVVPQTTLEEVSQFYPDLRGVKKKERTVLLREKMNELKSSLRQFLGGMKEKEYEFVVNGNILEAKLYNTGIEEVMEKINQNKAAMLYQSEDVFQNARYLYSTPDYDGDPNVYRWNYFYTPVQIGDDVVGVRIAIRDMATPTKSQIYNWGIKKDAVLDGGGRGQSRISTGVSSTAPSDVNVSQKNAGVNIVPGISAEDSQRSKQAKHYGNKSGLVRDDNLDKMHLSYRVSSTIDAIAKIAGVQVRVVEKAAGGSANGTYSEGVIELAMDSENPLMTVFTHELVHRIRETSPESYAAMAKFVQENVGGRAMKALANRYSKAYKTTDVSEWSEEMVADAFATVLQDSKVMSQFAQDNRTAFEKVRDVIRDMINAVKRVLNGQNVKMTGEQRAAFSRLSMQLQEMENVMADAIKNLPTQEEMSVGKSGNRESAADIVKKSLKWDSKFMDAAESANKGRISASVMRSAREARQAVADIFNNPDLADSLGLPPDIIGKTYIPNGSYSGTEENTTECIRTLAADDLMDAVAEHLGRPLTVEDTIAISQEYWKYTDKPECLYCYVAMDRKAHREFLGSYLQQRDDVVKNIESGMSKEEAYQKFLDGRKDTDPMKKRFNMWVNNMGKETISPADLASRASMEKAAAKSASFKAQVNDALKYAQSASWAKKRITYTAYDNHILKWKQNRIDNLNSNYGLRMYSFSDFSPAFILENMQMITDAAVRGLKVLAYTKELDFVRIFAETGMNINISVFGYNDGDGVAMDAMQGADWAEAQALRKKYSNVGCTFVATNDSQVEWALDQDWIDVIIPFHMVRTGTKVASAFGWKNYTAMSADTKAEGWTRENAKHILPPMHQNDKATYLKACKDNNLTPRFEDWVDHPNYMKLVNETRQSEGDTNPVQPVFDLDAAKASIETMRKQGGYYTPIGGSQENMRDIAEEIGKKIEGKKSMKSDSASWKEAAKAAKQDVKDARLAKMGKEYGAIKRGENPARDIQVPKRTAKDNKVSQTVRTVLEAGATPNEALPTIEKMVADGDFSYEVYGDKKAIKDAEDFVKHRGWGDATREWFDRMKKGEVSKKNTAIGWTLYNNAVNSKDMETAIDILNAMVEHQRNAAQAVQATRILKKMSPESQLYAAQKSVQRLQEELNERYGKKTDVELKIDPTLAEELMEAEDQKARDKVLQKIYKDIGRQIPSRFIDKWNAWRYLAMLGNPRTHFRNILGNAFFAPVVATKNLTATAIESAVNRVSGGKTGRTKAVVGFSTEDKGRLKVAWADYADVAEAAMDGGKYSDSANANKYIQEGRQIFGRTDQAKTKIGKAVSGTVGKGAEAARTFNSKALEVEDKWFSQPHYAAALASYCKANGITAEQMRNGKITDEARAYAIKEAQKATYRDTNMISDFFSRIGRYEGKNKVGKFVSTIVEGILPFRKTPANILARGLEYSPLGLLKSISYDLVQVKNGDMSATQLIDNLSAGLTGTGLLALGAFLAAQGLVRGAGGDDKYKKEFEDLMGHQNYSLEIGGKSFTLDWLAPEALPFFVGVNLWEVGEESKDGRTLADWLTAISNVSEPMMEMSCLQSLNDVFDSVGYASSNELSGLTSAVASAATSYLTQGIPTLLGQFERSAQDIRMTTYTDKNKKNLTGDMQYAIGSASGKIPGLDYNQIAYIDAWGRTESTGSMLERIINNMANPSYVSAVDESKMEKELMRLYNVTSDDSVFPSRASKYFSVGGKRIDLNGAQYVSYAKKKGQTAYNLLADLTKSSAYAKLTDTDKAKAVGLVYDYANAVAKAHVSSYKLEGWIRKADNSRDVVSYILKEKVGK